MEAIVLPYRAVNTVSFGETCARHVGADLLLPQSGASVYICMCACGFQCDCVSVSIYVGLRFF